MKHVNNTQTYLQHFVFKYLIQTKCYSFILKLQKYDQEIITRK